MYWQNFARFYSRVSNILVARESILARLLQVFCDPVQFTHCDFVLA